MKAKKYPGQGLQTSTGKKQTDNRQQNSIFTVDLQGWIFAWAWGVMGYFLVVLI